MYKYLPKSFAAVGLAVTVAIGSMAASTTEARADRDDLRTFLGAAAGIMIIGSILENRNHGYNHGHGHYGHAPVTRYVTPPATHYVAPQVIVPNLVAPSTCHRRFEGPSVDLRAFGAHCMQQHVPHYAALPNSCRESIFTYQGWRDVYDAQCLYRHGWVRS